MGIGMEAAIVNQAKKGQGETNDRLEELIAATKELIAATNATNALLAKMKVAPQPEG